MYAASSEARNATQFATSSGVPTRPRGIIFKALCFNSSDKTDVIEVEAVTDNTQTPVPDQASFRSGIVRLPCLPPLPKNRGDIDDPSPALFKH